jgi:large subunit ribosomal protein L24
MVIAGKDSGKKATVLKVLQASWKVMVEWVNIVTKHVKKQGTTPGQIIKFEKAIDASNVMLVCPFTDKPTRIGFIMVEEKWVQKKFRFSKKAVKENKKNPKDCIIK